MAYSIVTNRKDYPVIFTIYLLSYSAYTKLFHYQWKPAINISQHKVTFNVCNNIFFVLGKKHVHIQTSKFTHCAQQSWWLQEESGDTQ